MCSPEELETSVTPTLDYKGIKGGLRLLLIVVLAQSAGRTCETSFDKPSIPNSDEVTLIVGYTLRRGSECWGQIRADLFIVKSPAISGHLTMKRN